MLDVSDQDFRMTSSLLWFSSFNLAGNKAHYGLLSLFHATPLASYVQKCNLSVI